MRSLVGLLIGGKYRMQRHLGVGGIAEVYEAVHEQIGQRFAIKVLRPEYAKMSEVADRMLTEARAASAVGHPGIVQVFDIGRLDSGEPYLVMELLQGDDLSEIMGKRKRIEPDQAVGVCLHVLDALGAAHKAGVVHRDLKPENVVLVRGPGGEPWAKVIDFGIARLVREGAGAMRQTAQGTMLGTPYYVSPEQARGAANIDGRADLYAVGVMLFEMVTGKLPYDGTTADEIIVKALSQPFPKPRDIVPELPASLEAVILKATLRNRDQRYQSADEFIRALKPLRGELVAVQLLDEDDIPEEADPSIVRRLDELSQRVPSGERIRASVPPPDGRKPSVPPTDGRRPSVPPGMSGKLPSVPTVTGNHPTATPLGVVRHASSQPGTTTGRQPSAPPPPPRMSSRPNGVRGSAPGAAASVGVSAKHTVFVAVVAGAAAAAAVAGILLLVFARGSSAPPAAVRDARDPVVQTAALAPPPLAPAADVFVPPVMAASAADAGTAVPQEASPSVPATPADAAPAPDASAALEPDATAPETAAVAANVRVTGVPRGAVLTLDGAPSEPEFQLLVDDVEHALRVLWHGRVVWGRPLRVAGDMTIEADIPARLLTASAERSDGGAPPPPPPPPRDAAVAPLANPFQ